MRVRVVCRYDSLDSLPNVDILTPLPTDNLWLQGLAVVLTSIQREFDIAEDHIGYTTTALFVGLCIGASVWGVLSDIVGRRIAFNTTLAIAGIFGLVIGAAPNWIATASLLACLGTGVGGNLPVDGALFLEFLPGASGGLLTLLSVWWPVGQLIASLVAWGFIPSRSCDSVVAAAGECTKEQNMGWRYTMYTLGAITFGMVSTHPSSAFVVSTRRRFHAETAS